MESILKKEDLQLALEMLALDLNVALIYKEVNVPLPKNISEIRLKFLLFLSFLRTMSETGNSEMSFADLKSERNLDDPSVILEFLKQEIQEAKKTPDRVASIACLSFFPDLIQAIEKQLAKKA